MKVRYTDFAPARADVKITEVEGPDGPKLESQPTPTPTPPRKP
jgi:hypothetical protein